MRREGEDLVGSAAGRTLWRLSFPAESGPTGAILRTGEAVYAGHGNSLLQLDPESGNIVRRWIVSGPISALTEEEVGLLIRVRSDGDVEQTFRLAGGRIQEPVRFGTEPAVFGWLAAEAQVNDPAARLERDPTNPWLYLAVARDEPGRQQDLLRSAMDAAQTFYDLAGISRGMLSLGHEDLAQEAWSMALADFAARGYDPRLLHDAVLAEAYNFPLAPLETAIAAGDLDAAGFWAGRLVIASPQVPGTAAALRAYADALEAAGNGSEANYWRSSARLERPTTVTGGLDRLMARLGASGWAMALAILAAALLLYLTLWAKYWIPQSDGLEMRRARGASVRPALRVFAIRFFGFGEKLVLVLMLASALALAGLAAWNQRGANLPPAAISGTLANVQAAEYLTAAPLAGARGAFIRGYAAQVRGETDEARKLYGEAGNYPPALNNLGVLDEDEGLLRRAIAQAATMPESRYNLGLQSGGFPFHERFRSGEPVLAAPTLQDFQIALAGGWQDALGNTFRNPWTSLRRAAPWGLHALVWAALVVLFLVAAAAAVAWLFVPRPDLARNAPRNPVYHLLALLIPGSGLADEAWGFLLIVPWALVGTDALAELLGWSFDIGLDLQADVIALSVLYLVNLLAFTVEFISYRRRMAERRRRIQAI